MRIVDWSSDVWSSDLVWAFNVLNARSATLSPTVQLSKRARTARPASPFAGKGARPGIGAHLRRAGTPYADFDPSSNEGNAVALEHLRHPGEIGRTSGREGVLQSVLITEVA